MLLARRARPGLPRRRLPGLVLLAVWLVVAVYVVSVVVRSGSTELTVVLLFIAVAVVGQIVGFGLARRRVRALRDARGLAGEGLIVRTTAAFSHFPPREIGLIESYTHARRTYQVMEISDRAITLHAVPRAGHSAGAKLRFDRIESITVGTAGFADFAERAIVISGQERGRPYHLGIVPVELSSPWLMPVSDAEYTEVLTMLIEAAAATIAPTSTASGEL
ncbi:hypothetical protein [Agromyces sp. NPDC058110]|uniref:hypothetical protein n=1 Tax=Agromyces sp. NPDC058110 TaxID=3346345 RepID=UPI0036DA7164